MKENKFKIRFYPEIRKRKGVVIDPAPIRCSLTFRGNQLQIYTGLSIKLDKYRSDGINEDVLDELQTIRLNLKKAYETLLAYEDLGAIEPGSITIPMVRDKYNKISMEKGGDAKVSKTLVSRIFKQYLDKSSIQASTRRRRQIVLNHVEKHDPGIFIEDIDVTWMDGFQKYMIDKRMANLTNNKNVKVVKEFLGWAAMRNYAVNSMALLYKPKLKTPKPSVITLTWDEVIKLYHWEPEADRRQPYLKKCRDMFVFMSLSGGIRVGDYLKLSHDNILDDRITYVTGKGSNKIEVPINKTTRALLDRYKNTFKPVAQLSDGGANRAIKYICKILEFNTPITIIEMIGNEVITEIKPKHELITLHDARRTFNTLALNRGVLPHVVDAIMDHQPKGVKSAYIEVGFEEKKKEMEKMEVK